VRFAIRGIEHHQERRPFDRISGLVSKDLSLGWFLQMDHSEAALGAKVLARLDQRASPRDFLHVQGIQRMQTLPRRHLRISNHRCKRCNTHTVPPTRKPGAPHLAFCIMLARPPIFIIAIRATLLITYANGQVAAAFPDPLQDLSSEPQVIRDMQPFTHSPVTQSPFTYPMPGASVPAR
jgi:hypothetical protein